MVGVLGACVAASGSMAGSGVLAQDHAGDVSPDGPVCPHRTMAPAAYPPASLRAGKTGTVLVGVSVDGCGRVLEARVKQSSGSTSLDEAALAAARKWVLGSDAAGHAKADGFVEMSVSFGLGEGSAYRIKWPDSHKRPYYRLDESDGAPATIKEVSALFPPDAPVAAPPYQGMAGRFYSTGTDGAPEFWLIASISRNDDIAVRYRFVMEDGEPVVQLKLLCERSKPVCEADRDFLLKGPPMAKARKPRRDGQIGVTPGN